MSSRLSALSLQNLYRKKSHFNFNAISYFNAKLNYSSSVPNIKQPKTSDNLKNLQFPKSILPLANNSIDEILCKINETSVSPEETVSILKALRMQILFKNADSDALKNDLKFEALCKIFEKECSFLRPAKLVSGLRSLLEVGVSSNSSCVICAEENIIKYICLFSTFNIIGCLYFHHKYTETDLQKNVIAVLASELCRRVYEISTPAEILMLVHFLHLFKSDEDLKVIQQQIIKILPQLNKNELCKMLSTLSEYSNRNIYILKAITIHLQSRMEVIDLKEVLDLLYTFKKLNFYDTKLLSYLLMKVPAEIPNVTQPAVISGILTTCGYLKWKQPALAHACGKWIHEHLDTCRSKEFVSFILYVATVNLKDLFTQKQVKTMFPYINLEKTQSPDVWLDVVWSMAILNIVHKDILLQVLSPDFYNLLIHGADHKVITNQLKLLNLKALLKINYPECVFGCNLFLEPSQFSQSAEMERNRKYVLKVLNNFVPGEKYMCIGQNSEMGVYIDAEFIMDKKGKPLPITEYGLLSTEIKTLPEGYHRIALLILFYKDYTLHMSSVTGCYALASHLLSSLGYTVVTIPFEEFIKNSTEVKKAKYLFSKITRKMNEIKQNE